MHHVFQSEFTQLNIHYPNTIINNFKENININNKYQELRHVRNKIGGHLDENINLVNYIDRVKNIDLDILFDNYQILHDLFNKICHSDITLNTFNIRPSEMKGVIKVGGSEHVKPFKDSIIPSIKFNPPNFNNEEEFNKFLSLLVIDEDEIPPDAFDFFRTAFESSDIIKSINFEKHRCDNYRKVHQFFEDLLLSKDISVKTKLKILEIFNYARNGYPTPLLYILSSTYDAIKNERILKLNYIYQFGEIGHYKNEKIFSILKETVDSDRKDYIIFYYSLLSILKINIKNDGINNSNYHTPISENEYTLFIKNNIGETSKRKLLTSIFLMSEMVFNTFLASDLKKFRELLLDFFINTIKSNITSFLTEFNVTVTEKELQDFDLAINNNQLTFLIIRFAKKIEDVKNEYFITLYKLFILLFRFYHGNG